MKKTNKLIATILTFAVCITLMPVTPVMASDITAHFNPEAEADEDTFLGWAEMGCNVDLTDMRNNWLYEDWKVTNPQYEASKDSTGKSSYKGTHLYNSYIPLDTAILFNNDNTQYKVKLTLTPTDASCTTYSINFETTYVDQNGTETVDESALTINTGWSFEQFPDSTISYHPSFEISDTVTVDASHPVGSIVFVKTCLRPSQEMDFKNVIIYTTLK